MTPLTVTPVPLTATVAPEMKLVPASVTPTAVPTVPEDGETDVSVGPPAVTVKGAVPLVPPEVVTVTLRAPVAAPAAMVNVAVI